MPERPIGVTDVASGATVAEYRVRERVVAGNTVVEQYVLNQPLRVGGSFCATSFRTVGSGALGPMGTIFNAAGSGIFVGVRVVQMTHDTTGGTTTIKTVRPSRLTAAPTGGTALSKVPLDTAVTSSASVTVLGATASDGGAATAITATAAAHAGGIVTERQASATPVDQFRAAFERDVFDLDVNQNDPTYLAPGEGLLVNNADVAIGSTSFWMLHYTWQEFTHP